MIEKTSETYKEFTNQVLKDLEKEHNTGKLTKVAFERAKNSVKGDQLPKNFNNK